MTEFIPQRRGVPIWAQIIVWVFLVALLVIVALGLRRAQQGTVQPGQKIDNFTLNLFSGYEYEGKTQVHMEELRGKLVYELSPKIFRVVIELFINEKLIAKEENLLRLASHKVQLGGQETVLMDKIKKLLGEQPLAPPDLKEIEKQAGVPRNRLTEVIRLLEREGSVVRVTTDMYFLASSIEQLRATLVQFLSEKGEMNAAAFRDLIGSSRKYTIPLLEYFDRAGLTIRIGDIRRLKISTAAAKNSAH